MMNKKIIYLVMAVLILAALIAAYIFALNENTPNNTAGESNAASSEISIYKNNSITNVDIKNSKAEYTIKLNNDSYTLLGYENNSISQSDLKHIFTLLSDIAADKLVEKNSADITKYGLDRPEATAVINNETRLNIGSLSPDKKYRYINIEGNNNVYMLSKGYAELLMQDIDKLIDYTVTSIKAQNVNYVSIKNKNKPEILITADKSNEALKSYVSASGLNALIMASPLKDAVVYPTNMQDSLLSDLDTMTVSGVAEFNKNDLNKYGLDDPNTEITLKDNDETLTLKTGNSVDEKNVYALINDRPEIYIMTKASFNAFENADIMDFIQSFISLYPRSAVNSVDIITKNASHKIELKAEGDNKIAVDNEGVKRDNRNTYIDNKLIDKDAFGDFYEMLAGISFDSIEYNSDIKGDTPEFTITYNLSDGKKDVNEFYNYNDNFCFIKKNNNILVVNKQQLTQLENEIINLSK